MALAGGWWVLASELDAGWWMPLAKVVPLLSIAGYVAFDLYGGLGVLMTSVIAFLQYRDWPSATPVFATLISVRLAMALVAHLRAGDAK